MSASRVLRSLSQDNVINPLVNGRIFLAPVPQNTEMPYIAYELENDDPVRDLKGISNLARQEWVIFVVGDRFATSENIKDKVIKQISAQTTEFYSSFQSCDYTYEQDIEQHRFTISFLITYNT